jgi:16S rRNA (cytosine967-C5)-methyltransferase
LNPRNIRARDAGPPRDARDAALLALCATAFEGALLDGALERHLESLPTPRERGLARALAYGTCRQWQRLEFILQRLLTRPIKRRDRVLQPLLMLGLHQLLDLRIPAHAAVHETVELARRSGLARAAPLVNAVLRRALREHPALAAAVEQDEEAALSHPRWLLQALQQDWPARYRDIARENNKQGPMTLRVNTRRGSVEAYLRRLAQSGIDAVPVPGVAEAVCLQTPVDVLALPGFVDGDVSVQDAAAQLAAALLAPAPGARVLDACAAPGGKTAHLLETRTALAQLVAVEKSPQRLQRLRQGLARLGLDGEVECLCADALSLEDHFTTGHFDAILLDAPCSASGVIRRHPDIKLRRVPADIVAAAHTQRALLAALWPLLARGGTLLYATCSVLAAENDEVMQGFLAEHPDARTDTGADTRASPLAQALPAGSVRGAGHQILPGDAGMDGFFYARLRKS